MKKYRTILALFIALTIFALAAYTIQQTGIASRMFNTAKEAPVESAQDTNAVQDTTPFMEKFQNEMEVLQVSYSKKLKRDVWTLGKGRTIINYLLQAQRILKKYGGKPLYMEELHNDPSAQSALLDALTKDGDTLKLKLQVSENIFRDNSSFLSIAFQVKTIEPEYIVALNELDYPYDLLIIPFGVGENFFPDLDRIKNKELAIWLLMEDTNLDYRHKKLRPVRIHHTEQYIESIINNAKELVPSAKGIVTRYAKQAVEHKQLLNATLNPIKKQNMWFIDNSGNSKSKVGEVCEDLSMACKETNPFNPDKSNLDDYIKRQLKGAAKNGVAAIILPLDSIARVKTIKEKAVKQGTTIVNLSTFMKY